MPSGVGGQLCAWTDPAQARGTQLVEQVRKLTDKDATHQMFERAAQLLSDEVRGPCAVGGQSLTGALRSSPTRSWRG